uniref:Secreted protein n=2 Tax=Panagrellus redivivus TaxID=6233 RepID=A0A7E4ZVV7_PANRE
MPCIGYFADFYLCSKLQSFKTFEGLLIADSVEGVECRYGQSQLQPAKTDQSPSLRRWSELRESDWAPRRGPALCNIARLAFGRPRGGKTHPISIPKLEPDPFPTGQSTKRSFQQFPRDPARFLLILRSDQSSRMYMPLPALSLELMLAISAIKKHPSSPWGVKSVSQTATGHVHRLRTQSVTMVFTLIIHANHANGNSAHFITACPEAFWSKITDAFLWKKKSFSRSAIDTLAKLCVIRASL